MKGKLDITARVRSGKTVLENVFFCAPFKLADISAQQDKCKKVMIMNASPGVLDNDAYIITIKLDAGAQLQVATQSYQRLFQMQNGATQHLQVNMMTGSDFTYLPHPSVPHKGSHFTAANKIFLSDDCRLIWGEVITPGRMLHAEQFEFTFYQSKTEIYLNEKLFLKDNLILSPGTMNIMSLGNLEGHTHQAGLFFIAPGRNVKTAAETAQEILTQQTEITWGITQLQIGGFALRMLGKKAEPLYNMLQKIASILKTPQPDTCFYEQ